MNLKGKIRLKVGEQQISYSLALGIFAFFVSALFYENILNALTAGTIFFSAGFFLQAFLPEWKKKKNAGRIESELPFALISVSIDLDLNISFEKCILNAAKESGSIGKEFRRIFADVKSRGMGIPEALLEFSKRTGSIEVKRAVLQLNSVYEHGSSGKTRGFGVRRIAEEMLAKQRTKNREFSGKLVVFSLLFIAVSAIIPALFQSFAIVGSMVLKMSFAPHEAFAIIVIGFPLVNVLLLFYIRAKTPIFMRG